jgi:MFS family permease
MNHEHRSRYAWYVVLVMTTAQIISFTDRYLPSLLVEPLKAHFHLRDLQIGLLLGPAFVIFYATVGVAIGWLADRFSRRLILATGIAIWCCMTAASSLVAGFVPLFCLRLGVGLGEASMSPCAISLITDYVPRARRPRALGIYMMGAGIGAGCAFLFVGPLVHWLASNPSPHFLNVFGIPPWQTAFALVGLPGLLLVGFVLSIREPQRTELTELQARSASGASLKESLRYMWHRWRAFGTLLLGAGALSTLSTLNTWNVALFRRIWDWNVAEVGRAVGLLFFTAVPIGTLVGLRITRQGVLQGRRDAIVRALVAGLALAVPGFALYPLMPTAPLAIAVLFVGFVGQATVSAASPAALMLLTPGQVRSQIIAVFYLVISLVSLLFGPPPVGWMADLMGDPRALRYAMTLEALVFGIPALILVCMGLKHYARAVLDENEMVA